MRQRLLILSLWTAVTIGCICCQTGLAAITSPAMNVLFITADDLGLQLGCYGETLIRTPHLDALAASGTRFKVAYVAQASCSPSRSAMFTGLHTHGTGQYGLVNAGLALHPQLRDRTISNLLKKAGYRTGIIGKLHVAPEASLPVMDDAPSIRGVPFGMSASSSFTICGQARQNRVLASTVIRPTDNRRQPPLQTRAFRRPSNPLPIHPNSNCTI